MNARSALAVFGYILIGALATGAGTGFFLYQANSDRAVLAEKKIQAERQAEELLEASQRIADEANQKLEEASEEVAKTRARLQALETEQRMIKDATILTGAAATRSWKEVLNIPMGVSVRVPTRGDEIKNDAQMLTVGDGASEAWLEVRPWTESGWQEFLNRVENPKETYYLVSGRLLVARRGKLPGTDEDAYAVRVQTAGTSTHVIWAKEDRGFDADDILNALSSLTFRS